MLSHLFCYANKSFVADTRSLLLEGFQRDIRKAYKDIKQGLSFKGKSPIKNSLDLPQVLPNDKMFHIQSKFESCLPTVVLFIDQDPFTNVAMNLDVNFCCVHQQNFMQSDGENIQDAILMKNGKSFQNSHIHLLFYEKIKTSDLPDELKTMSNPELTSMSWCRFKENSGIDIPKEALKNEIILLSEDFTAQFVSMEQYLQLLFILGQKADSSAGDQQNFKKILKLFNLFKTNLIDNFKAMLNRLQFPFEYNEKKTLAVNRQNFKDFFSCLTNVRCAVIEGAHRCEAASWTLQGYKLGDYIPLEYHDISVPSTSTLFKRIMTEVYNYRNIKMKLDDTVLKRLKDISEELAEEKEKIVKLSWLDFFNKVLEDINNKTEYWNVLYKTQEEFYREEVQLRGLTNPNAQSNQIKKYLHEVLTKAIFQYKPCKELLVFCKKDPKPSPKEWGSDVNKFLSLSADPYHVVSGQIFKLFNYCLYLTQKSIL
jgi:hypothetical protein